MLPYGTEALGVMRIEKGHPAGNELNGQTTAGDLGMARLLAPNKDFIGRVMAQRPGLIDENRPQLVGIRPLDPALRLRAGGHLLLPDAAATAANVQGRTTSVAFSPSLGHWIGLALVDHGPERWGEELILHDDMRNARVPVVLCNPVFIDPEGVRLRG
jgi:sarcosine oxidase subunit alpha